MSADGQNVPAHSPVIPIDESASQSISSSCIAPIDKGMTMSRREIFPTILATPITVAGLVAVSEPLAADPAVPDEVQQLLSIECWMKALCNEREAESHREIRCRMALRRDYFGFNEPRRHAHESDDRYYWRLARAEDRHDEYVRRAEEETGLTDCRQRQQSLSRQIDHVEREMWECRATTLDGLKIKARISQVHGAAMVSVTKDLLALDDGPAPSPLPKVELPRDFDPFEYIELQQRTGIVMKAEVRDGKQVIVTDLTGQRAIKISSENFDRDAIRIASDANVWRKVWEALKAIEYIKTARDCGLEIVPWQGIGGSKGILTSSLPVDNFGPANHRFSRLPIAEFGDVHKGVVFDALCHELCIDPDDPDLCTRVNEIMTRRELANA